jgi:hypothetical protein
MGGEDIAAQRHPVELRAYHIVSAGMSIINERGESTLKGLYTARVGLDSQIEEFLRV